jgi:hypothetical protein
LLRVRGNANQSRRQGLCFCYEYLFGLFTSFCFQSHEWLVSRGYGIFSYYVSYILV